MKLGILGDESLYEGEFYYQQYIEPLYELDPLDDLAFWKGVANENYRSVLELACGYGRILSLFTENSRVSVTGIDASLSMIDFGRKKYPTLDLIHGDMCDFQLAEKFDLIFLSFNSFLHLTKYDDLRNCLSCVKDHLSDDGKLIITNTNISPGMLKGLVEDSGDIHSERALSVFRCPRTSDLIVKTRVRAYEPSTQRLSIDYKYNFVDAKKEESHRLIAKIYFPVELHFLLQSFGLKLDNVWGDYDRGEFTSNSPEHITVWSLA